MIQLIDNWLPWLADLTELGGPVLVIILLIAALMWALLFERVWYLAVGYPQELGQLQGRWCARREKTSWYARQARHHCMTLLRTGLSRNYPVIATLIKICPLLGLLGTVMGMLEVFDALAATGSNNPRSMAAGVSKATVSTLAGMVVAIFGLLGMTFAERRAKAEQGRLASYFEST